MARYVRRRPSSRAGELNNELLITFRKLNDLLIRQPGRRQRRVLSGPNAERNYRASQQSIGRSLLLASHRQSLFQRTILHDTSVRQKCKCRKVSHEKLKFNEAAGGVRDENQFQLFFGLETSWKGEAMLQIVSYITNAPHQVTRKAVENML